MVLSVTALDPAAIMHEHTTLVFGVEKTYLHGWDAAAQAYVVPEGVSFIGVVAGGPANGPYNVEPRPSGGVSVGTLRVTPGQVLYVMVGEHGGPGRGGWNGGAKGWQWGGAGATDIRTDVDDLDSRLIVAGGAGGYGSDGGGDGGGDTGGGGLGCQNAADHGGTQTQGGLFGTAAAGSFGKGGECTGFHRDCTGGGGGWYGGGGGTSGCEAGGGGSGHIASSVINGTTTAGQNPSIGLMYIVALHPTDPAVIMHEHTTLAFGEEKIYTCINDTQTYTVPESVRFVGVVAAGPANGPGNMEARQFGGISAGVLAVTPGQLLHVMVGGVGASAPGFVVPPVAWNGGGSAGRGGSGGSGATDIRTDVSDLHTRLIVAGGAGGSENAMLLAGFGGGEKGGDACASGITSPNSALGGNQTHGGSFGNPGAGSFGQGGGGRISYTCGGGGGWYGGSAPTIDTDCTSGGGGSGHIASSVINGTMTAGRNPNEGLLYIVALYTGQETDAPPTAVPTQAPPTAVPTAAPTPQTLSPPTSPDEGGLPTVAIAGIVTGVLLMGAAVVVLVVCLRNRGRDTSLHEPEEEMNDGDTSSASDHA